MLRLSKNKVAVAARFDPPVSPGGIIIPEMAMDRCDQGIVKYIGPDVTEVKVGDYVLFSAYDGATLRMPGNEGILIILVEESITCAVEGMNTEIPGLYFKGVDGDYFPANWEMAAQLVQDAFTSEDFVVKGRNKSRFKEEYKR